MSTEHLLKSEHHSLTLFSFLSTDARSPHAVPMPPRTTRQLARMPRLAPRRTNAPPARACDPRASPQASAGTIPAGTIPSTKPTSPTPQAICTPRKPKHSPHARLAARRPSPTLECRHLPSSTSSRRHSLALCHSPQTSHNAKTACRSHNPRHLARGPRFVSALLAHARQPEHAAHAPALLQSSSSLVPRGSRAVLTSGCHGPPCAHTIHGIVRL